MKRVILVLAVIVIAAFLGLRLFGAQIGKFAFERAVSANVGRDATAGLPDGLHVALCGTGSPMSDPTRVGPCTAVIAGRHLFAVDMGSGAARNFSFMGLPIGKVEALFLTHFHSDHIDGVGEAMTLRWANGANAEPLPLYGPAGVENVAAGFNAAYAADRGYRVAHHGADIVPPSGHGVAARPFSLAADELAKTIYDADGVKVTAFIVNHFPARPAVGYRFDYGGRSVVISGDAAPDPRLAARARGADLLVHEALNPEMVAYMGKTLATARPNAAKIMSDIPDYHTSPAAAAKLAKQAGVRMLVLSHVIPPLPTRLLNRYFLGDAANGFDGEIVVGEDGMLFSLPKGSSEIARDDLM